MPVYQYKGKHYELPDGLSPEQAKSKIETHLAGEQSTSFLKGAADLAGGVLETATTGMADFGAHLTGKVMTAGHALATGRNMSEAQNEFDQAYDESAAHQHMKPVTKTGQWIEDKIGKAVEYWKDKMPEVGADVADAFLGQTAEANPEIGRAVGAIGSAIPEVAAVAGLKSAGKPSAKGFDFKRERPVRGINPDSVIAQLEGQDRPQLTSRRPGAQGELFPQSNEGLASPYDAGQAGVTEPIQPLRARAQMELPLGETPDVMAVNKAGEVRTGMEDPGLLASVEQDKANVPGRNAFNEMATQLQPKESPFHNPAPADPMAWMAQQAGNLADRGDRTAELSQLWKEQAMAKDRQAAAQRAVAEREGQLQQGVARNVDLNEHGLDRTQLTPDNQLTQTGREGMETRQTQVQGQRVLDKTMDAMARDGAGARAAQVGPEIAGHQLLDNQVLEHMVNQKVESHPLVQKAVDKIDKQEQLLIKVAGMLEEGRATASQLARVQKELNSLREAAERTRTNVQRAVKDGETPRPFNFRKQGGAINPEVMKEGFQKLKQLADGTWLRAYNDGTMFHVDAMRDGHKLGHVEMAPEYIDRLRGDERNMKAYMTHVRADMRGKGYAQEMYKFVSELGNDVQRSESQTPAGKAMWDKFHEKGIAKKGVIPKKQIGGINFEFSPQTKAQRAKQGKEQSRGTFILGGGKGFSRHTDGSKWQEFADKVWEAKTLQRNGKDVHEVWQKTGLWQGKDGAWRFEIPDTKAALHVKGMSEFLKGEEMQLADVLNHPEFFQKYPELRKVGIRIGRSDGAAHFDAARNEIVFNPHNLNKERVWDHLIQSEAGKSEESARAFLKEKMLKEKNDPKKWDPEDWKVNYQAMMDDPFAYVDSPERSKEWLHREFFGTLLHEIQHAVQSEEGFQPGMNWRMPDGKIDPSEWSRTHGELEAEAVRERARWPSDDLPELAPMNLEHIEKHHGEVLLHDPRGGKEGGEIVGSRGMRNKQRGAIQIDPGREPERKVLDNIPGIQGTLKGLAPSKWTPEQAIEAAKNAKDLDQNVLQKLSNWFTKGGQYMVDRADNNPVIRYGVEKVKEAENKTRADVANFLHDKDFGLGAATRNMDAMEQKNIWALLSWADHNEKAITPELLRQHGATEAQIKYAEIHRQVMDHAHEQINKVWEALGKGPVSKRVSYAAMNASGDYRRVVYQGEKVVGMIGSDLRWRVNGLKNELEKRGYTVGEEKYVGAKSRDMGNAQAEMQQMLEFFAKNDPRVEELLHTVGEITSNMAKSFMNMEVHTKAKKGIFGMDGRKAVDGLEWGGMPLTRDKALANAREGLKAQMNYAEMAIKWGHLTDAIQDVKQVLKDKEVSEKQPMAKQWTNDYISKAIGANPTFGHHLEQFAGKLMGETGIGYSNLRTATAVSRRIVNTVLLGLNPGFWATNVIQPFQAMPGMKAMLTSKGLRADFDIGTGWAYLGKGAVDSYKVFTKPGELTGVLKDAYNYARENHVYGSDLIEHSNHVNKGVSFYTERISSSASGSIELTTRAPVFYGFVRMLAENGMSKEHGLFEAAHNLTDMTMNNYSRTERPKVYDAMGPVGELASNLASYKHNELSRLAMFAREAGDANVRPLLTHLTATVLASGVKGVVGYNALDWLMKHISEAAGKPTSLTKELMNFSEWVGGKIAPHVLSHGLFSLMGVDMANRLGLGDALTPSFFPGGSKLLDIAGRAKDAALNPDEANVKELAREVAPGVATGPMDLTWFSKGDLGSRRSDLAGSVRRTPADKIAKAVGFTGIHESVEKQKLYENKWVNDAYTDLRKKATETMKGEIYMNKTPSAKSIQKYMDARGDVGSLLKEIERIGKEQNMSAKERDMLKASAMKTAAAQGHLQDLVRDFNGNK